MQRTQLQHATPQHERNCTEQQHARHKEIHGGNAAAMAMRLVRDASASAAAMMMGARVTSALP